MLNILFNRIMFTDSYKYTFYYRLPLILPVFIVISLSIEKTSLYASDHSLYILRKGTFLINNKLDPYMNRHFRASYAQIGTVVFIDGQEFTIQNEKQDYREELYVPIITESGIRAAILKDCLITPQTNKLIVPQHISKTLNIYSIEESNKRIDYFSRSDGKFAEIVSNENNDFRIKFPFVYSETFNEQCGECLADHVKQKEGLIRNIEIKTEGVKIIDPVSYRKSDILRFEPILATPKTIVDSLLTCFDGEIFPKVSQNIRNRIADKAEDFMDFLAGCGLEVEADLSLRGELFGVGGGVKFSRKLKPRNRKLLIRLYEMISGEDRKVGKFLVIKRLECEEEIATKAKRFCLINLNSLKSYNLLESEVKNRTNLEHLSWGDEDSRQVMVTIGDNTGHDDVFKLYNFILGSKDFREFVSLAGSGFDYGDKRVRTYLDFIVKQIADFRRDSS